MENSLEVWNLIQGGLIILIQKFEQRKIKKIKKKFRIKLNNPNRNPYMENIRIKYSISSKVRS